MNMKEVWGNVWDPVKKRGFMRAVAGLYTDPVNVEEVFFRIRELLEMLEVFFRIRVYDGHP